MCTPLFWDFGVYERFGLIRDWFLNNSLLHKGTLDELKSHAHATQRWNLHVLG